MSYRAEILSLYKTILRLGRSQLKLTDQQYFKKVVGAEFRRHGRESDPEELTFQLQVRCNDVISYNHVVFIYNRKQGSF